MAGPSDATTRADPLRVETRGRVRILTFDRPEAKNALNAALIAALARALGDAEADNGVGAIVLTGGSEVFAAGADLHELAEASLSGLYLNDPVPGGREAISLCRKPVVAAVAGYALGGGCELALMCDLIVAAESARFGQPEITVGTVPGAGGTQRLARTVGKYKAMDLCLTARLVDAAEADRLGLVSRVVPTDRFLEEALAIADRVASMSLPVTMMVKEAVNRAFETTLAEGLRSERRIFHSTLALDDQREGARAFLERRAARFQHR